MRAGTIQFVTNAALVTSLLFLPQYMEISLGASEAFVGVTASATALATFLTSYVFGRWADMRGRRLFLLLGLASSGAAAALQYLAWDPLSILGVRCLLGFCVGIYPSALLVEAHDQHMALGRFAAWGSLGWAMGSLATAVATLFLTDTGRIRETFLLSAAMFAAAFVVALPMPVQPSPRLHLPRFPSALLRRNLAVYGPMFIRHTGANMIWVIFPLYLDQDLHISKFGIGVLYAINSLVQFTTMRLLQGWPPRRLFILGLGLSGITFLSFTQARDFWAMVPTQVALGISWGSIYVGALELVFHRNVERTTAVGLLGSTIAVAAAAGPFLGGFLSDAAGRPMTMYVAAAMAAGALGIYYILEPRSTVEPGVPTALPAALARRGK